MRYNVIGADRNTGNARQVIVEACSQSEAESLANEQGLLISSVQQAQDFCSYCGANLPADAHFCPTCGRQISTLPATPTLPHSPAASPMHLFKSWIGGLMIVGGVLGAIYFLLIFDSSVPLPMGGRVNNLGLMADRQNGLIFSFGVALLGVAIEFFTVTRGVREHDPMRQQMTEQIKSSEPSTGCTDSTGGSVPHRLGKSVRTMEDTMRRSPALRNTLSIIVLLLVGALAVWATYDAVWCQAPSDSPSNSKDFSPSSAPGKTFALDAPYSMGGGKSTSPEPDFSISLKRFGDYQIISHAYVITNESTEPLIVNKVTYNGEFTAKLGDLDPAGWIQHSDRLFPIVLTIGDNAYVIKSVPSRVAGIEQPDYAKTIIFIEVFTNRGMFKFDSKGKQIR